MSHFNDEELDKIIKSISKKATTLEKEIKDKKIFKVKLSPLKEEDSKLNNSKNWDNLEVTLEVLLGKKRISLKELSKLNSGTILALEEDENEKVSLYVNDKWVGSGEIVAIDGHFGVKITELFD